jgi:uncharacterized membrane protein YbaN (DUF454 family)
VNIEPREQATAERTTARLGWIAAGWVFLALGIIGAFLPVMPTTCFLIGALACFTRGSPRMAAKLLAHPRYGPTLRAWQNERAIPTHVKCISSTAMVAAWVIVAWASPHWVTVVTGLVLLTVILYIVTRPVPAVAGR